MFMSKKSDYSGPERRSAATSDARKKQIGALGWVVCLTALMADANLARFSMGPLLTIGVIGTVVVGMICYYILKKS